MAYYRPKTVCQFCIKIFLAAFISSIWCSCNLGNAKYDVLPYYNSQDLTPTWDVNKRHVIANFSLMDQNGKLFNADSLKDKIYIANFFFTTCPSICPKMTKSFKILQDSILNMQQVELVSFTVMPWVDSVQKLKTYGLLNGVNSAKWHLLTGVRSIIYSLGRSSFFADNNKISDTSTFLHTDKMYLIDKHQRIRGVYNATQVADVYRVLDDIRALK